MSTPLSTTIMYHYVREDIDPLPNKLSISQFRYQLEVMSKIGFLDPNGISQANLVENRVEGGFLLTFDDGLAEHADSVVEVLNTFGVKAVFFVNPATCLGFFPPVHKVHWLLNKVEASLLLDSLRWSITDKDWNQLTSSLNHDSYPLSLDAPAETLLKRCINWSNVDVGQLEWLNRKFQELTSVNNDSTRRWHMTRDEVVDLSKDGHIIGSHGMYHGNMAYMSDENAFSDLKDSKHLLETWIGKRVDFFAFPFGGTWSYKPSQLALVEEVGYKLAFSVGPAKRDEGPNHLQLARTDCAEFSRFLIP